MRSKTNKKNVNNLNDIVAHYIRNLKSKLKKQKNYFLLPLLKPPGPLFWSGGFAIFEQSQKNAKMEKYGSLADFLKKDSTPFGDKNPQCSHCFWFANNKRCPAYPSGIPDDVYNGVRLHDKIQKDQQNPWGRYVFLDADAMAPLS